MGKATYTVTVTNNSNGVSVDYETETPMTLLVPEVAAEVIKDLVIPYVLMTRKTNMMFVVGNYH